MKITIELTEAQIGVIHREAKISHMVYEDNIPEWDKFSAIVRSISEQIKKQEKE